MQRETKYDLKGQRFGKLTVIERVDDIEREWNGKRISRVAWLCKCDCGNMCKVTSADLINEIDLTNTIKMLKI